MSATKMVSSSEAERSTSSKKGSDKKSVVEKKSRRKEPKGELEWYDKGPSCLGRTVIRWVLSVIYLACIWSVLAVIFAIGLYILCKTLEDGPRYYGENSFIGGISRVQIKNLSSIAHRYLDDLNDEYEMNTRNCFVEDDRSKPCKIPNDSFFQNCKLDDVQNNATYKHRCFGVRLNHILKFVPDVNANDLIFTCTTNHTEGAKAVILSNNGKIPIEFWNYNFTAERRKFYKQPVLALFVPLRIHGKLEIKCSTNATNVVSEKVTTFDIPKVDLPMASNETNQTTTSVNETHTSSAPHITTQGTNETWTSSWSNVTAHAINETLMSTTPGNTNESVNFTEVVNVTGASFQPAGTATSTGMKLETTTIKTS